MRHILRTTRLVPEDRSRGRKAEVAEDLGWTCHDLVFRRILLAFVDGAVPDDAWDVRSLRLSFVIACRVVGKNMDQTLQNFLRNVRPGARPEHLQDYEEVAWALEGFLRHHRRSLQSLRRHDVRGFLGYWYLRHCSPKDARHVRRFCAATLVLLRWLVSRRPLQKKRGLLSDVRQAARETSRAARVSELLGHGSWDDGAVEEARSRDDHWRVIMCADRHLVLRSLSTHEVLGPVELPEKAVALLLPGAILNLRLARLQETWCVLGRGFCYPSSAASSLLAAGSF